MLLQCIRGYLACPLSLRNLKEMMAERGIDVDHARVSRWGIRLTPFLNKAFRLRMRTDETYNNIKLLWEYQYHTMDTAGHIIDFLMTDKRDTAATLRFFGNAIRHHGEP